MPKRDEAEDEKMRNLQLHSAYFVSMKKVRTSVDRRAVARVLRELNAEHGCLPGKMDIEALLPPCLHVYMRLVPGTRYVVYFVVGQRVVIVRGVGLLRA